MNLLRVSRPLRGNQLEILVVGGDVFIATTKGHSYLRLTTRRTKISCQYYWKINCLREYASPHANMFLIMELEMEVKQMRSPMNSWYVHEYICHLPYNSCDNSVDTFPPQSGHVHAPSQVEPTISANKKQSLFLFVVS
jgi:hypothetical protein